MKVKTARRFLTRNNVKMIRYLTGYGSVSKSFLKRWKQATSDYFKKEK